MTKKGALAVTNDLDKLANHFQTHWAAMGVPQKIASDFAYRCDLLSDQVDKFAGIDRKALSDGPAVQSDHPAPAAGFDPEAIGEEKSGPEEKEGDEGFMDQHFSQQENRELTEAQERNELGPDKTKDDRQVPQAGIQASAVLADRAAKVTRAAAFALKAEDDAVKSLAQPLTRLARALSALQADALNGKAINGKAQRAVKAADHLLPTLAKVSTASVPKITEMAKLATRVASGEGSEISLLG
jgi:hypothetical protein